MKKTLLITLDFPPRTGGVARYLINLAQELPSNRLVVLNPFVGHAYHTKFPVYTRNLVRRWLFPTWLPMFWHILRAVRREGIEMLWVAQPLPVGTVAWCVSKIFRIPYVVNIHGMDIHFAMRKFRKKWFFARVLHGSSWITVNSEYTAAEIMKLGDFHSKVRVVYPCPGNEARVFRKQAVDDFLRRFALTEKRILLTVGRLVQRKGNDILIRSLPRILEKVPNVHCVMVGAGEDENRLRSMVHEYGVEEHVTFSGRVSDDELALWYQAADVFVMLAIFAVMWKDSVRYILKRRSMEYQALPVQAEESVRQCLTVKPGCSWIL